jgi:hypothetical protein
MGCGGNITGINGSLTSPNYPGNYSERHTCRWFITAPARRVITITFTNINILGSPDCNRAYVEVHNGYMDGSPSFGKYCGNVSLIGRLNKIDGNLLEYKKTWTMTIFREYCILKFKSHGLPA